MATPTNETTETTIAFDLKRAGKAWRDVMAPHADELGIVRKFPRAARLQPKHLADAKIFADRYNYIDTLPRHAVCAEVGVWKGEFSAYILQHSRPQRLHLIDIDLHRFGVQGRFATAPVVTCHQGNSIDILRSFPPNYFDWVYIDAGHTYDEVRADADAAVPAVKSDGVLIFNDYIFWSHTEARPYGVVHAVNEICVNDGWKVVAFCLHEAMYCDIAIKRA